MLLLRHVRARPGDTVELLIDAVRIAQRDRQMAGLSKFGDPKEQRFVRGHLVITAASRYRGVVPGSRAREERVSPKPNTL